MEYIYKGKKNDKEYYIVVSGWTCTINGVWIDDEYKDYNFIKENRIFLEKLIEEFTIHQEVDNQELEANFEESLLN